MEHDDDLPAAVPSAAALAEPFDNRLRRIDRVLRTLPAGVRRSALTLGFRMGVPFFGAARAHIEEVEERSVVVRVANRRQVRNHVQGVHAVAMALSAETATGVLVAMNLRDRTVPLLVTMNVRYLRRSQGDLTAHAHFTPEEAARVQDNPRGEITVPVEVRDAAGVAPIVCEMVWAWRRLS